MGKKTTRARTSIQTEFQAGRLSGKGKIRNVGEGGLFVGTASIPAQGDYVQVRFRTPAGDPMEVAGMVWWTTGRHHRNPGFGLRLLTAGDRYQAMVREMLR
jgi:hypothetical protein